MKEVRMKILTLILFSFFQCQLYAQDVWLQNYFSPLSGCTLSNSELVNVLINNNSALFIPANTITVSYTINGGPPVSELLPVNLFPGASWNFTFSVPADLSACMSYNMNVTADYPPDPNLLNNTLDWVVVNDCVIVPGTVQFSSAECAGSNSGVLNLVGWTNGSITNWESSINGGASWTNIANVTTSQFYSNLVTTTLYRVQIDGGFCPSDSSGFATITVDTPPTGGTINSSATHCESSATGVLDLVGAVGAINFWEYSEDGGASWTNIANPTSSEPYTGLLVDRWYRVQIEGGGCPDAFSDTAIITVDALTVGGTLGVDQVVCEQSIVPLVLSGNNGVIQDWEYSTDLIAWNPLGVAVGTYNTPPLTQTTYYRVEVTNGVCPSTYSDTLMITVETNPVGGTINGSMQLCAAVASDTLVLTGYAGASTAWEQSTDNGVSWGAAAGTNDSLIFSGLGATTWYRVFIDGGSCPDVYSDTAIITIYQDSYAGILMTDATICAGETVDLSTVTNVGATIVWESTVDLVVWNAFANDVTTQTVSPAVTTTYRIIVQNMTCPGDTSNVVLVAVNPLPIVNAGADVTIAEGDTVQLNGTVETVMLWSPATDLSNPAINDPLAWPLSTTTYTYTVTTDAGCQNSDDITITVQSSVIPEFEIRNLITGNGDGYNDFWMITGIEFYPETEVTVFNIYGQLVYRNEDYKNDWAGTYKDEKLPNGTYYYCVRLKDDKNLIKGNLTILGNE